MPTTFGSGYSFAPETGQLDQVIDPVSGDYVRNDVGEWEEEGDSRTTVLLMISIELGASPFDPDDGTTIAAMLRDGDPVTPEDLRAETLRAVGILQTAGIITDLDVTVRDSFGDVLRDQSGRTLVRTSWRDLASGASADLILQPG
jgi:hypothetical protein